jgi:hypothetical protein
LNSLKKTAGRIQLGSYEPAPKELPSFLAFQPPSIFAFSFELAPRAIALNPEP